MAISQKYNITTEDEWYQAQEHKKFLEGQLAFQFNQVDKEVLWLISQAMDKYIQSKEITKYD